MASASSARWCAVSGRRSVGCAVRVLPMTSEPENIFAPPLSACRYRRGRLDGVPSPPSHHSSAGAISTSPSTWLPQLPSALIASARNLFALLISQKYSLQQQRYQIRGANVEPVFVGIWV